MSRTNNLQLLRVLRKFALFIHLPTTTCAVTLQVLSHYYTSRNSYYGRQSGDPVFGVASDDDVYVTQVSDVIHRRY